jgi:hypothetical protein
VSPATLPGAAGPNVFLAHSSADKPFVETLASHLRQAGVRVWFDQWNIQVGQSIVESIQRGLEEHDQLVLVLSPDAVASEWVRRELNSSLMRGLSARKVGILPVLYRPCTIPALIADLKYADFTTDYASGFRELAAALGLVDPAPASAADAHSVLSLTPDGAEFHALYPYTFADFPECLFASGAFDVTIVVCSTAREHTDETSLFSRTDLDAHILGTRWKWRRDYAGGTVRDLVRVVDLAAYLGHRFRAVHPDAGAIRWPDVGMSCVMDLTVSEALLRRNLILVGGADDNLFISIACIAWRQRFGYALPIRFRGDDLLYFTCDRMHSELSGQSYPRVEDAQTMHAGFVQMAANPWNPEKVMVLAVGTRATGTQAALLALMQNGDDRFAHAAQPEPWRRLAANNRHHPHVPAKVVRASKALVVEGSEPIGPYAEIEVSTQRRISQRHAITAFEFLE